MLHNEEEYANANTFYPERFLETASHTPETDPYNYAFGFGRR